MILNIADYERYYENWPKGSCFRCITQMRIREIRLFVGYFGSGFNLWLICTVNLEINHTIKQVHTHTPRVCRRSVWALASGIWMMLWPLWLYVDSQPWSSGLQFPLICCLTFPSDCSWWAPTLLFCWCRDDCWVSLLSRDMKRHERHDEGKSPDVGSEADSALIGHYSRPKLIFLVKLDLVRPSNALPAGLQFFQNQ